jgi:hypothetical protein
VMRGTGVRTEKGERGREVVEDERVIVGEKGGEVIIKMSKI